MGFCLNSILIISLIFILLNQTRGSNFVRVKRSRGLKCPQPNGLFPFDKDCSKFLNCAHGRPYLQSCAPGTLFNWRSAMCDFPYNVRCGDHIHLTTTTIIPSTEEQGSSLLSKLNKFASKYGNKIKDSVGKVITKVTDEVEEKIEIVLDHSTEVTKTLDKRINKTISSTKNIFKREKKESENNCLKPTGQFPYPKDCSKYINCWKGRGVLQSCSPGTLFDASSGQCSWPHLVICASQPEIQKKKPTLRKLQLPSSGKNIRLRGGGAPYVGYVEIWFENKWIPIVIESDQWDARNELCQRLGFERGSLSESRGEVYGPRDSSSKRRRKTAAVCAQNDTNVENCPVKLIEIETLTTSIAGIRCQRNPVSECLPGWDKWGSKCYFTNSSAILNHAEARDQCISKGSRLISLLSQQENDFISDLLGAESGTHSGFHTGGVKISMHGLSYWIWEDSDITHSKQLPFQKWWPGWSKKKRILRPTKKLSNDTEFTTDCITLHDKFSTSSNVSHSAEYFFWKLGECEQKLALICEMDPLDIGCISGQGEFYNGNASVTASGAECLHWNTLGGAFKGLYEKKNVSNNFCANPDGDDLPWCFVKRGTSEFCDIPRCSNLDAPVVVEEEASLCNSWSFKCSSGECIHQEWVCDGQLDCPMGEEEQNCPEFEDLFEKNSGLMLVGSEVEKWVYSPKSTCAIRCAQAKHFVCYSYNYQESTLTCILNKGTGGSAGGLEKHSTWEYHERIDLAPDCTQSFICNDSLCLDHNMVCNGQRDCNGGEDEQECIDLSQFQIRLVNGSSANQGRVEIKIQNEWGQICDDMWDLQDGHVACKQLGYKRGAIKTYGNSKFGEGNGIYIMDDLNCRGDEDHLANCDFGGWYKSDCKKSETAGITCYRDSDSCSSTQWRCGNGRCIEYAHYCDQIDDCGDNSDEDFKICRSPIAVRLVNGTDPETKQNQGERSSTHEDVFEGRVEIRFKGVWGTLCDDDIKLKEAHVLCRMMGWKGASSVYKNNKFGSGDGPIWLDGLQCLGKEDTITLCRHESWGRNNCDHSEDLGLTCSNQRDSKEIDPVNAVLNSLTTTEVPTTESSIFPRSCGISYVKDNPKEMLISPRIVDGQMSRPGAQPWMAGLRRWTSYGSTHECGAFILSEDLILTAAHCVVKYKESKYIVRTGDFNNEESDAFEKEWRVESIRRHSQFDKGTMFNNDIALIKIKKKGGKGIEFNERVQPICLLTGDFDYPVGLNCTVAGWGTMSSTSGYSRILQSTMLPILPDKTCRADHVYGATRISQGMFCAGYMEGGIDTCQGDSGGPLVCMIDGRYTAVGITSWGHGCARANKPGVYTKLTTYLGWIYDSTLSLENELKK